MLRTSQEQKKKKKLSKNKVGGGTQKRRKELSTIDPDDPTLDGVARFWVPEVGRVAADPDDVGDDGFFVMSTFLLLVGGWYALKEGRGWLGRRGNRKYYPLDEEVEEEEEERGGGGGSGAVGNKNGGGGKKNPQAKKSKKKNNRSTSKSTDSKNIEEEVRNCEDEAHSEEQSDKLLLAACSWSPHYHRYAILTRLITQRQSSCDSLRSSQLRRVQDQGQGVRRRVQQNQEPPSQNLQ